MNVHDLEQDFCTSCTLSVLDHGFQENDGMGFLRNFLQVFEYNAF